MTLGAVVSRNVKALRLKFGLSQQEVARRSGLTIRYLSRLENSTPNVTLEVLEKLAKGLGCTPGQLLGERRNDPFSANARAAIEKAIQLLERHKRKLE